MTGRLSRKQLVAYVERGRKQGWLKSDPLNDKGRRPKSLPKPGGSALEAKFELAMKAAGITGYVREHRFCERGWRFDFAWIDEPLDPPEILMVSVGDQLFATEQRIVRPLRVAVEIEGGVHDGAKRGRHIRADGFRKDAKKYGRAAILGWIVLRVTSKDINDGSAINDLISALEVRKSACNVG